MSLKQKLQGHALVLLAMGAALLGALAPASAQAKKPNIVVIWGDDIGYWNVSAYNQGMMGYKTPNIDRIAKEGALFTDWYGQQSCTAGRAAFLTGQVGFRTGLLKVGLPGAKEGLQARDVTLAQLLKAQGPVGGDELHDGITATPGSSLPSSSSSDAPPPVDTQETLFARPSSFTARTESPPPTTV